MAKTHKIAVLPGDGIGPEVTAEAVKVIEATGLSFEYLECSVGGQEYLRNREPLPDEAIDMVNESDVVLLGAVGHELVPDHISRQVLIFLRMEKDTYANLRPLKTFAVGKIDNEHATNDIDTVIIRDNSEGFSLTHEGRLESSVGMDKRIITNFGAKRIIKYAYKYAEERRSKNVTCICQHKWLYSDLLFRKNFLEVSKNNSSVASEVLPVDVAAMMISRSPEEFDIIVTPNLYGDILTGIFVSKIGGVGMAPSACIGDNFAYFESVHGAAWDIVGSGVANPVASILSAGLMLQWLGEKKEAWYVETAVKEMLVEGVILTPDLGGHSSTSDLGNDVARRVLDMEAERREFESQLVDMSEVLMSSERASIDKYKRTDIIRQ